jgi:hypothetical protein
MGFGSCLKCGCTAASVQRIEALAGNCSGAGLRSAQRGRAASCRQCRACALRTAAGRLLQPPALLAAGRGGVQLPQTRCRPLLGSLPAVCRAAEPQVWLPAGRRPPGALQCGPWVRTTLPPGSVRSLCAASVQLLRSFVAF